MITDIDFTQKEKLILAFKKALKSAKGSIYVDVGTATVPLKNGYISAFRSSCDSHLICYGILREEISENEFNELNTLVRERVQLLKQEEETFERNKCEDELNHFLKN